MGSDERDNNGALDISNGNMISGSALAACRILCIIPILRLATWSAYTWCRLRTCLLQSIQYTVLYSEPRDPPLQIFTIIQYIVETNFCIKRFHLIR